MMKKEEVEKKIKELKQAKCYYPIQDEETGEAKPCGKKQMMTVSLPILNTTESGNVVSSVGEEGGVSIPVPFCDYHTFLAMSSRMFGVKSDDKLDRFSIIAPFDMINIAEAVVDAMAMTGKIQEIFKTKEETERKLQELKKQELKP